MYAHNILTQKLDKTRQKIFLYRFFHLRFIAFTPFGISEHIPTCVDRTGSIQVNADSSHFSRHVCKIQARGRQNHHLALVSIVAEAIVAPTRALEGEL